MSDYKIGQEFERAGKSYMPVPGTGCKGCCFSAWPLCNAPDLDCMAAVRADETEVVFVEAKK